MRLYDVCNDTFITDRKAIIDRLVATVASLLTFSERRNAGTPLGYTLSPEAVALLTDAKADLRVRQVLWWVTRDHWRAQVTAEA